MDTTLGFALPWLAVPALLIAAVWTVVWPRLPVTGLTYVVVRWFHPLAWVWVAAAAVLSAVSETAMRIALILVGVTYVTWFVVLVRASNDVEG